MFKRDVAKDYDVLMKRQQKLFDKMANAGRKKDYVIQKKEKKYNAKVDILIRKQNALALQIEMAKRYVKDTDVDDAEIVVKTQTKKKA